MSLQSLIDLVRTQMEQQNAMLHRLVALAEAESARETERFSPSPKVNAAQLALGSAQNARRTEPKQETHVERSASNGQPTQLLKAMRVLLRHFCFKDDEGEWVRMAAMSHKDAMRKLESEGIPLGTARNYWTALAGAGYIERQSEDNEGDPRFWEASPSGLSAIRGLYEDEV